MTDRTRRRAGVLLFFLASLLPRAASGQPPPAGNPAPGVAGMTLEQLLNVEIQSVTGASRFNQEVVDAPAAVTIITREEIYTFGYRTLAEVLRAVRDYYVSNDRNYSYLGVRGFSRPGDYNTRVLLLLDGHRMNDNVYDQAAIGTDFPLDMDLVERIEVIRGPASSLYGSSAFFGVINVVTVRPTNAGRAFGTLEAGSQQTLDVRGGGSRAFANGTEGLFAITGYRTSGQPHIAFPDLGGTPTRGLSEHADGDAFWNVFGTLRRGHWNAEVVWGSRTKEIPTGAFATTLSDPRNHTIDNRGFVSLGYDGVWRQVAVVWEASYDRYRYDGTYVTALDDGSAGPAYTDYGFGEWLSSEISLTHHLGRRHLVSAGGDVRGNFHQDQGERYPDDPTLTFDTLHRSGSWSAYVEDQFTVTSKLLLQAGMRFDDMDPGIIDTVSPRAALIYKPSHADAIKLLFGQAFRAPNAYEFYYYTRGDAAPLSAEKIRSLDAAWERYFGKRARISAGAFLYDTRDLITESPGDTYDGIQFLNRGRTRAAGLGLESESALPAGLHATVSYTFTHTRDLETDLPLTNSPRHLAKVHLAAPVARTGLLAGIEFVFVGDRLALDSSRVPRAQLWNLTLSRRDRFHGFGIGIDVKNVFDRANSDPGNQEHPSVRIPQNGRTIRARITWQY